MYMYYCMDILRIYSDNMSIIYMYMYMYFIVSNYEACFYNYHKIEVALKVKLKLKTS